MKKDLIIITALISALVIGIIIYSVQYQHITILEKQINETQGTNSNR